MSFRGKEQILRCIKTELTVSLMSSICLYLKFPQLQAKNNFLLFIYLPLCESTSLDTFIKVCPRTQQLNLTVLLVVIVILLEILPWSGIWCCHLRFSDILTELSFKVVYAQCYIPGLISCLNAVNMPYCIQYIQSLLNYVYMCPLLCTFYD